MADQIATSQTLKQSRGDVREPAEPPGFESAGQAAQRVGRDLPGFVRRAKQDIGLLAPAEIQALQRTIGNQAVTRLIASAKQQTRDREEATGVAIRSPQGLQAKLTIGAPNDVYEKEADSVAEQVTSNSSAFLLHDAARAPLADEDAEKRSNAHRYNDAAALHRTPTSSRLTRVESGSPERSGHGAEAPSIVDSVLATPGQPLAELARQTLQPGFGHDFSDVRVHDDSQAAESASAVNALAYTVGNHIVFGQGQYAPGTAAGRHLLAHELTHTIQQTGGKQLRSELARQPETKRPSPGQDPKTKEPPDGSRATADSLNHLSKDEIENRLKQLTPNQVADIHQEALANPRLGPKSEVAQLTAAKLADQSPGSTPAPSELASPHPSKAPSAPANQAVASTSENGAPGAALAREVTHADRQSSGTLQRLFPARQTRLTLQRQAPDDKDTSKVDALIDQVGAECDAFAKYKASPLEGAAMPGTSIQLAVSRWDGGPVEPWMRGYIKEKMGPLRGKLLQEMMSMSGVGWPDYETLFDVSYQLPEHKYTIELKAATTIIGKALQKLAPKVTIKYSNTFGWNWQRDYSLAGLEMSAGISAVASKGKKVKPKGGLSGGTISLDISGSASADPVPIRYCGPNDFTGLFTVVKGSAGGHLGPGSGKLGALTAIVFHGTPDKDVSFAFITPLNGSVSGGATDAGVDVSIGGGAGKSIGGETTVTPPPELEEVVKLTKSFREWEAVIGPFATGQASVSPEAAQYLDQMHDTVYKFKQQSLDPITNDLQAQSIDPAKNFQLTFDLVGMASRRWSTAGNSGERQDKNTALSLQRAAAVETEIHNRFPDAQAVTKEGLGAHSVGPTSGNGSLPPMLDDAQAQQLYEEKKKEALAEPDPVTRRMMLQAVEANYGPGADQQAARRVYVFCRWEGLMTMKSLVPASLTSHLPEP